MNDDNGNNLPGGGVSLVNRSRVAHVIVLDHDAFKNTRHGYAIRGLHFVHDRGDGLRGIRNARLSVPASLTLLPGQRIDGLPPEIRAVTQVAALLREGQVVIELTVSPRGDTSSRSRSRSALAVRQDDGGYATLGRTRIEK